ncbi:MAG: succinate dehydrogenase assembly factor 2 [Hyphomicrobiales bacterium]|nr:succinate dehydrogenase assembly factor 2 [Hyphomicrobiales bacterium]MCY4049209.1 succinate dehydrogenase assembly factor 2 [Hyphomicrobiales bacterium]MCY4052947.1 succinate dehydrogenase assembly factor 2 [Hyphomicrobiales bacterium]
MNDTNLETKRKKLRFRAWHRGIREADLLLGGFADQWLDRLDAGALERFETLLETPDPVLFDWICGRVEVPGDARSDVLDLLLEFHKSTTRRHAPQ